MRGHQFTIGIRGIIKKVSKGTTYTLKYKSHVPNCDSIDSFSMLIMHNDKLKKSQLTRLT